MTSSEQIIEYTATRIERAVDAKDWPGLRALLADDMTVNLGDGSPADEQSLTADAFIESMRQGHPRGQVSFHTRSNSLVSGDENEGTVDGLLYAWCRDGDDPRTLFETWGRLLYRFRRIGGQWRCHHLTSTSWRTAGLPPG
jgi:ketosteroid isomerase-like protein